VSTWDDLLALVKQNQDQPTWGGLSFTPSMENRFQSEVKATPWFSQFKERFGEEPNLDTTDYNTRRAWFNGILPTDTQYDPGLQHWTSKTPGGGNLKSNTHPTSWMNTYMEMTGKNPMAVQENLYKKLLGIVR
jgi:hypothetical protein